MTSLNNRSNIVNLTAERVYNGASTDFPGYDSSRDSRVAVTESKLKVVLHRLSESLLEFDLIHVDPSLANALRRIIISEVPTVAIESVYIWNNTSIVQDEVLAQRLGLIPLKIDPHKLIMKQNSDDAPTDLNTIVFNLVARCVRRENVEKGETDPEKVWSGTELLSSQLVFDPKGSQRETFSDNLPRAADENILLAKLRGGQEIVCELHSNKGIGKDHAKFSPVATCSYRLLPEIKILKEISPEHNQKFKDCFSPGVVEIQSNKVHIVNPRLDSVSREVLRHAEFEDCVALGRVRDHFIFSLESTGQYCPQQLVPEAVAVLKHKLKILKTCLKKI